MKLLLDTHIWLWAELEPEKLAVRVRAALRDAKNEIWLSPISIWELMLLAEKGRIKLSTSTEAWVDMAWSRAPLHEAPLTRAVATSSRSVRVPHQDPADRFLAATAQVYELTLVTDDANLLRGKGFATLPNR